MTQIDRNKIIFLTAGGTGGHMFPAHTLGEKLKEDGYQYVLLTDPRGMVMGKKTGFKSAIRIFSASLRGNIFAKFKGLFLIGIGFLQSLYHMIRIKPAMVAGFGGYPTVPVIIAAKVLGIPILIHEQNSFLGKANLKLSQFVNKLTVSFPNTEGISPKVAPKTAHTGMPVRNDIASLYGQQYFPLDNNSPLNLLILGGSLGAKIFSDIIPEAMSYLPQHYKERIFLTIQVRPENQKEAKAILDKANIHYVMSDFFSNIPQLLSSAHLVISRAGASTIAELTCAGRPSILIPYPKAAEDHQAANARILEKYGAAWVMPEDALTPRSLATRLEALFALPGTLPKAAEAAQRWAHPNAADLLKAEALKIL